MWIRDLNAGSKVPTLLVVRKRIPYVTVSGTVADG
jgi:hypothetical protein